MASYARHFVESRMEPKSHGGGNPVGTSPTEQIYPEREGYGRSLERGKYVMHIGYTSPKARVCKCGSYPVLEQFVLDRKEDGSRNIPAESFVAICPRCELRAKGEGALEEVLETWNRGEFSEDNLLVSEKLSTLSLETAKMLGAVVVMRMIEDAIDMVLQKHKIQQELRIGLLEGAGNELKRGEKVQKIRELNGRLKNAENFLRYSPLMFDRDPDAVISDIRKAIYPGNTAEDIEKRMKIPLRLAAM